MAEAEEELQALMPGCLCIEVSSRHSFASVRDAVLGREMDNVLESCDELARGEKKWMFLYRCRVCETVWAMGCYDRGHVMFYYLFPAPPSSDPVQWLNEEAGELPAR